VEELRALALPQAAAGAMAEETRRALTGLVGGSAAMTHVVDASAALHRGMAMRLGLAGAGYTVSGRAASAPDPAGRMVLDV